jgi:penicillin-binding protein 1A
MKFDFLPRFRETWRQVWVSFQSRTTLRKIVYVAGAFIGASVSCVLILFILTWTGALGHLPDKEELKAVENPLATEVYSADSVLLGRYFVQERSNVNYATLPRHVVDAVVATEDIRFFEHSGIDGKSLLRVMVKSILLQQESSGGGSTLTQQLAKNLYPRREYWLFSMPINKIREMILASRLEAVYNKESLLALYLNTVPFGDNTYGIEAAAQRFYSVHAAALTVDQAAVLIGMLKATSYYNPRLHPERAAQRRNVVLAQMKKYNKLSPEDVAAAQALPVKLSYNQISHHSGLAPYFREYIREELQEWCEQHTKANGKAYNLYTDGLKIYTTIDSRLQQYAEIAVNNQMAGLQKRFLEHWGSKDPWYNKPAVLDNALRKSERYRSLARQGLGHEEIIHAMQEPVLMNVLAEEGEKERVMSPYDSVRHYLRFLQAGMLALDPRQGAVRVWVGGINHQFFQYDHVRENTRRQIGSTFKPIVYAAALEQGVDPCDFVSAAKTEYTNVEGWKPENTEENYDRKYSLTGGLAYSVNTVSVRVLEKAGIDNTIALARRMGIESDLPAVPAIALGAANISMIEMVRAYACFVNNGKTTTPYYLTAIHDHTGKSLEVFTASNESVQAMSPETAQMMVEMLKHTVNEGTATGLRSRYGIHNDIAGKTGTTQSNADGWFIAMTPRLVIGSWVGADDPRIRFRKTSLGQGARTALPIVGDFLHQVNADNRFASISQARFPALYPSLADKLACDLYRSDSNMFQRLFGKKDKEEKRAFGEPVKKKKGFLKRLFGR